MKIRITHKETNTAIVFESADKEKSLAELSNNIKNKKTAKNKSIAGQRSDKIRTYNFQRNQVINHLSGNSFFNLKDVLEGDLEAVVNDNKKACDE